MRVVVVDGAVNPTRPGLPVLIAGRYLVGPLLGRGGAAEVYQAHDQVLDRAVAVKLFLNGTTTTDPRRQHREVTTLAGLSHPGLVTLYNAGEQDGRAFFVMQLVAGRTLADRLQGEPAARGGDRAAGYRSGRRPGLRPRTRCDPPRHQTRQRAPR